MALETAKEYIHPHCHGTTRDPKDYSFAVNDLDPGLYRFRLKQIDFDGAFEYSPVVEAAVAIPDRFLIEPAYPNPFNPTTTLRFAVAAEQHVEVTLINSAGQSIRTLYSGAVAANEMQQSDRRCGPTAVGYVPGSLRGNGYLSDGADRVGEVRAAKRR